MGPFGHKTDVGRNCFKTAFLQDRRHILTGLFSLNIFYSMMKGKTSWQNWQDSSRGSGIRILEEEKTNSTDKIFYLQGKVLARRWGLPRWQQWPMLKSQNLEQKPFWQILNSQRVVTFTFESAYSVHNISLENNGYTFVLLTLSILYLSHMVHVITLCNCNSCLGVDCKAAHR